jgi:hypothetical protein
MQRGFPLQTSGRSKAQAAYSISIDRRSPDWEIALTKFISSAQTVNISTLNAPKTVIPGVTSFATTGAEMTGLSVRAMFSSGLNRTLAWSISHAGQSLEGSRKWPNGLEGMTTSHFECDPLTGRART